MAVGVLSALSAAAFSKLWDLVKEKIQGKGYALDLNEFKSDHAKRKLIHHLL